GTHPPNVREELNGTAGRHSVGSANVHPAHPIAEAEHLAAECDEGAVCPLVLRDVPVLPLGLGVSGRERGDGTEGGVEVPLRTGSQAGRGGRSLRPPPLPRSPRPGWRRPAGRGPSPPGA